MSAWRRWAWPLALVCSLGGQQARAQGADSFLNPEANTSSALSRAESAAAAPAPSAERVAALRALAEQGNGFARSGAAFRDTLGAILQGQHQRVRRARDAHYAGQISLEQEREDRARLLAIASFEQFVARYPGDVRYTPDALLRLGELYFERDAIGQQARMNAYLAERDRRLDHAESLDDLVEPAKDYSATLGVYQRIVSEFPTFAKIDGVFYLIGYCHDEMGESGLARQAWLNLVCANQYRYLPGAPAPAARASTAGSGDPFANCVPSVPDSKFWAETWLRIGEYQFDFDFSPRGIPMVVGAYQKVLQRPQDRAFNLALYKLAWTYYRASRYPEAMAQFAKLVQWSEDQRQSSGKGSELREEAITYLAIGFAYDDWNENQVSDPTEGMPRGIERVADPALLPQDRSWTRDVYFRLGSTYFDEARYPEAIAAWELALARWPLDARAPETRNSIAQAYTRRDELPAALAARAQLADYAQGGAWWEANKDHPAEQRRAEQLAEEALVNSALSYHQQAQAFRQRCVEQRDLALCSQAQELYRLAAAAYKGYVERYPNNPESYELEFNRADALYWSESYAEAAQSYATVRDSNLDDEHLAVAARLAVESEKRLVEVLSEKGELTVRTEPPVPSGTPPRLDPIALPEPLQRLARARETYLARVDVAHDSEHVRDAYFYNNAVLLYLYGYWPEARQRFWLEFSERCSGAKAGETGQTAWLNLRNMAASLQRDDEVRLLGEQVKTRACTFAAATAGASKLDCALAANKDAPACVAGQDLTNLKYRQAVAIFEQAEKAAPEQQPALYEQAASRLVAAVDAEPGHAQAPLALERAAIALERTSRFEAAGRLYQRILDDVAPRVGQNEEEQNALDAIVGNAYFRLAYNANRAFDVDRAVANYQKLADSDRFVKSKSEKVKEWREGALVNAAKALEFRQQYARAAEYYTRAAAQVADPAEQLAAHYRVAEMAFKLGQWSKAIAEMKAFIARHGSDAGAGELVVQAYARIAQARKAMGSVRDYQSARKDVVVAFQRSGQEPGTYAAEYAAQAQFEEVDEGGRAFDGFAVKPGSPATLEAYVKNVAARIEAGSAEAKQRAEAYNAIPPYRRPSWTLAAFVRQGRVYEVLAKAVLNTPFVVPADLQRKMRGLPEDSRDEIKIQVEDTIRQLLDSRVRPIECLAVARYALAARAARAGSIDSAYSREAFDRINAYGDERIAECIAQATQQDASFAAYQPGEFKRAPRGLNLDIASQTAPPPLSGRR